MIFAPVFIIENNGNCLWQDFFFQAVKVKKQCQKRSNGETQHELQVSHLESCCSPVSTEGIKERRAKFPNKSNLIYHLFNLEKKMNKVIPSPPHIIQIKERAYYEALEKNLAKPDKWLTWWQMKFSINKCKIMDIVSSCLSYLHTEGLLNQL